MGRLVNKRELEELFEITQRTLTEWQKEGMPIKTAAQERGKEHQYDTAAVHRWIVDREIARRQIRSPRDQLDLVKMQREELALKKDLRQLIDADELRPLLERFVQDVVAVIEAGPDKYAMPLHQTPDLEGKHQLLKELTREIRVALGQYDVCTATPAGGAPGIPPPA